MSRNLHRAKQLRQEQTEAEDKVWWQLRNRRFVEFKFRRQVPLGSYIVDFICFDRRLIIELDGGHHNEESHRDYDAKRDDWLRSQGFKVLRFWNDAVFNEWDVIEEAIWQALQ